MLALTALILTFVGSMLMVNMTIEYRRDFERAADRVLYTDALSECETPTQIEEYIRGSLPLFSESCDYYVFEGGNIICSSKEGGILKMTQELAAAMGKTESDGRALDRAVNVNGYTLYMIDSEEVLGENILDMSFLFLQALVFGVILAAIISYFISKRLTHSIKKLEQGALAMSEGEFCQVDVTSNDEIGNLCRVFNDMGRQIQSDYDEFERVESSRREFVANVSHELKTPLTVIKSYSETLTSADVDPDTAKQFLSVIDGEVDRMTGIVGQLLSLSRLETPGELKKQEISLERLCTGLADSFYMQAQSKEVAIVINGSANTVTDYEKLKTILTNLISNAVKYSKKGTDVIIEISAESVSVINYGIPIDEKDLPHIFERFYRTDKARNRETGGTGLGLAIAKESADAIGASLTATSDVNGRTEFRLEF